MTKPPLKFPVPISSKTRVLFFEPTPGHSYLFDLYGQLPRVQFVGKPGFFWTDPSQFMKDYIAHCELHLRSSITAMVFMTADMFLHAEAFPVAMPWLERSPQRVYGLLHEVPGDPASWERLRALSSKIQIIVLAEEMKSALEDAGLAHIHWLPHHAVHFQFPREDRAALRNLLGIPPDAFVATFLGELRKGKGIELILESLKQLRNRDLFLNFAGKATDYLPADLERAFRQHGVRARLNISRNKDPSEYRVMSDRQYTRELLVSNTLLLPYIERQSRVMSGVLPDAVHFGVPVLCTQESMVGRIVEKYGIGRTFSAKEGHGLGIELNRMHENGRGGGVSQSVYANLIDSSTVLKMLASILRIA